jgi:predicted GH43/DUF377 family glycosyl hydrolase
MEIDPMKFASRRRPLLMKCAVLISLAAIAWPAHGQQDNSQALERWMVSQKWEKDVSAPIVGLGTKGQFDDMHIFAPAVAEESGVFRMWYSGSRGTPGNRVFRLGLATSSDGKQFEKYADNPVLQMDDGAHSVLTPGLLRNPDGTVLRDNGRLRMWFASATLGKGGLHTLHETSSADGIQWEKPSEVLLENCYCPTIIKSADRYEMWFSDVSRRPWVIRHASSLDGRRWQVTARPAIVLNQSWEGEVLVYPTVLKIDGSYLMWYGSYDNAIRRETTAIGFAVSPDGQHWQKHPQNPVMRPDRDRPWESNYVGSGCVMRLADGSFRYWYASRKQPPFNNLYFAINTARWSGLPDANARVVMRLPPQKGDEGELISDDRVGRSLDVLEVIDEDNAIVRAWYRTSDDSSDSTFTDIWIRGVRTKDFVLGMPIQLSGAFRVDGNQSIDTTCGKRSFVQLVAK